MATDGFAKLRARWQKERTERERWSAELRRRLIERGGPVLGAYGVREAWLFGSVADGKPRSDSDLDLLVMPIAVEHYWSLRRDLEDAVGRPLDLYTQDDDPIFVSKVKARGELIYEVQS
jgi:predicted nucleotidyltransferase